MKQNWPKQIWIVRHGESAGNVARDAADLAGHARIDIAERDVDVPLSALGEQQSDALAAWFSDMALSERPMSFWHRRTSEPFEPRKRSSGSYQHSQNLR